jgi:hypothetical protein
MTVDRQGIDALHGRLLAELAGPGDWWDGRSRRAIMDAARTAADGHVDRGPLPAAAVDVIHRVVNDSGQLTPQWADIQIDALGDGPYAEVVGVTAIVTALDVYARAIGEPALELPPPSGGSPSAERPGGVGDVGAWIAMTEEKALANVARALSLVPRTNATWRALVTESYSRGPEMLELTWQRALTRPQIELVAAQISRLQECFY